MAKNAHISLLLLCVVILSNSPSSFAFLEGKAFRHGDIEDTLSEVAKKAGGFALGALIGKGGSKFGGLDIKRVYFGNWLRDYSQAVDVAGLQKLQLQTIINLCMVLGFMAHGYATNEFEVTEERLGVYLPTEHIDNPKGYPDNARQYHPKLRPPVDPRELEIDPRTGMKNYIANENGSWDTSKALVRRTLERCIHLGRQARANGAKQDMYEAYRLLGQALHTLEDFPAHSNFCELALVSMGHTDVFVHVGDQVKVQARNGKWVAPLVTGTFGSSDFIHSLLGEATDHISQASVTDLNAELDKARAKSISQSASGPSPADALRSLLFKLPGSEGQEVAREMESVERIRAEPTQPGGKRPEDMSPQELHAVLWQVLTFRDSVVKKIEKTIEKIPGLGPLIEKLMDSISVFIYTTLEPFLKPIMKQATTGLMAASGEVINTHDQYEVFNDPRASDPTHSFLSKDHFNLILNEPAGHLGKIVLIYTVNHVVRAWDDTSINVHSVTEDVLQCLFHPDFHDHNSQIQREMLEYMQRWVQGLGAQQHEVLRRLTKDAVRNHQNIRLAASGGTAAPQGYAHNAGVQAQHQMSGYISQVPGLAQAQSLMGKLNAGAAGGPPGNTPFGQATSFLNQFTGGQGGRREGGYESPAGPPGAGYPSASPGPGAHSPSPMPPTTGQAASYYSPGQPQPGAHAHSPAPPPVSTSTYPGAASNASGASFPSPSGPPPPGGHGHGHGHGSSHGFNQPEPTPGYAPSYAPSYNSPPPGGPPSFGFPQADAGYSGQSTYPGQMDGSGYPPYGGPPPPPGPPAGFGFPTPDMPPPGPGPHGHHHHHHGGPPPPPGGYPGERPFGW
ncbi:heterokaryon incompatibility protein Het-C-domain-containing protein [Cubamyces lactineus]|nr:heterokaryon incompatibility protein Het-C-domain-containing protein [Cubamyces lactineus]